MEEKKKIIFITGRPGSGKSTAARELREWGIYPVIETGDQIKKLQKDYSDEAFDGVWDAAQKLRDFYGDAGAVYPSISEASMGLAAEHCPGVIISGIRSPAEIEFFEEVFPEVETISVAIRAPEEKRQELFFKRGDYEKEYDDPQVARAVSDRMMQVRTEREERAGLEEAIMDADYFVWNDSTKSELGISMAGIAEIISEDKEVDKLARSEKIKRNI